MFFSTYVLTKKGPLAKVWLAAHWDKRLTRNEVRVVDLSQTILHIVRPVVPIALRTSGELLVGVVRIYALKVKHLLKEATEATLFLRVTTLATKGSRGAPLSNQHRTTSIDGVLVAQKGEVEAVTFDWADAAVSAKDAADALGDGRFDAIADLLGTGHRVEGPEADKEDGLLASAWYTVQPTAQSSEELHNTQQDYDEIAKMRADLMAFGERGASGSASTSKSKSSLASVEKGRGSVNVDAHGLPFPAVGDDFDIGVPLPDELPLGFPDVDGVAAAMAGGDPFLLPDEMTADAEAPNSGLLPRAARKPRAVHVLDLQSTTLSREAFEKGIADRSDVLNSEPRRGPYDAQEAADRFTLSGATNVPPHAQHDAAATAEAATAAAPLSNILGSALRTAFAAALQQSVAVAAAREAATARLSQAPAPPQRHSVGGAALHDDDFAAGAAMPEEGGLPGYEMSPEQQQQQRKRGREEEAEDTAGLSLSARQTLARLRGELSRRAAAASRKKPRTELPDAALVGASCTVQDVCQGLRRRDAARAFVDVLALASKQYVSVQQQQRQQRQETELGEITVRLNESAVGLFATA